MIVAILIVVAALGGGGYYGYSKWKAKEAPPQVAGQVQPAPAEHQPQGQATPAAPTPAQAVPVQPPAVQESAAAAAGRAQPSGKQGTTPAASASNVRTPPRPAKPAEGSPAPLHPAALPAVPAASRTVGMPPAQNVPGTVQSAKLIQRTLPVYPALAREARISGVVRLRLLIGTDGAVKELSVISGNPLLTQAALDAVRQWRYQPTIVNGEPTEVLTEANVNFTLSGSGP